LRLRVKQETRCTHASMSYGAKQGNYLNQRQPSGSTCANGFSITLLSVALLKPWTAIAGGALYLGRLGGQRVESLADALEQGHACSTRIRLIDSSTGIGSAAMRSASVEPSIRASANARTPSDSTSPKMGAMLGWLSEASTLASRSKRALRSGSAENAAGSTSARLRDRAWCPWPDTLRPSRLRRVWRRSDSVRWLGRSFLQFRVPVHHYSTAGEAESPPTGSSRKRL